MCETHLKTQIHPPIMGSYTTILAAHNISQPERHSILLETESAQELYAELTKEYPHTCQITHYSDNREHFDAYLSYNLTQKLMKILLQLRSRRIHSMRRYKSRRKPLQYGKYLEVPHNNDTHRCFGYCSSYSDNGSSSGSLNGVSNSSSDYHSDYLSNSYSRYLPSSYLPDPRSPCIQTKKIISMEKYTIVITSP